MEITQALGNLGIKIRETQKVRIEDILKVEELIKLQPGAMIGDCFPLVHTFVDGAYVRQITMPKGALLTSKIHKILHPYFVLKGDVSVITEDGVQRIKAPYWGLTKPGTKRILYIHEDTVWITVHVTGNSSVEEVEKEIIAESYDDIPNSAGVIDITAITAITAITN